MTYVIEKGIPVSKTHGRRIPEKSELTKFLEQLEVGDSFLLIDQAQSKKLYAAAKTARKTIAGLKVVCRKTSDGYRAWRIA